MTDLEGMTRAELVEAFDYLDELRESGRTNMLAGASFIQDELGWPKHEARLAAKLWRESFALDVSAADRADNLIAEAVA